MFSLKVSTSVNATIFQPVGYQAQLEEAFHRHKRPVWLSWWMDETYIKVKGEWR